MAHYLSPERLSTKVHYAPGGHSSLSLGWDPPPPARKYQVQHQPQVPSRREEPKAMEY